MLISPDTETNGLDITHGCLPFIVSTFDEKQHSKFWEWEVNPLTRQPVIPEPEIDEIAHRLEGADLVFQNAIFDLRVFASIGLVLSFTGPFTSPAIFSPGKISPVHPVREVHCGQLHDTQLLSHAAYSPGANGSHALKDLTFYYLEYTNDDEKELHSAAVAARRLGKKLGWKLGTTLKGEKAPLSDYWMPKAGWDAAYGPNAYLDLDEHDVPDEWYGVASKYAVKDPERTLALFYFLMEIAETEGLVSNYEREVRLSEVIYNMTSKGMAVSKTRLLKEHKHFTSTSENLKAKAEQLIKKQTGLEINVNSDIQFNDYYRATNIFPTKVTKKGFSFDAPSLYSLAQYCETHDKPQEAEVFRCLVGFGGEDVGDDKVDPGYRTYVAGARYLNDYKLRMLASRLYPSWNQSGTKFTRLSCSAPNGQNISMKAVLPLRRVFGPPKGFIWLDPDYSQIELRIFACVAKDQAMIDAFARGDDFHKFTASRMYGLAIDQIGKEQKRNAKAINFKAIYGGIKNVPVVYSQQFPRAASFMQEQEMFVREHGYILTVQGDRIYIDPEKPYVAVDAICQGSAGRVVKDAMQDCHDLEVVDWDGSAIVGNIHDQVIFEISLDYPILPIARTIKRTMEAAGARYGLDTPVDMSIVRPGKSWADSEKLDLTRSTL